MIKIHSPHIEHVFDGGSLACCKIQPMVSVEKGLVDEVSFHNRQRESKLSWYSIEVDKRSKRIKQIYEEVVFKKSPKKTILVCTVKAPPQKWHGIINREPKRRSRLDILPNKSDRTFIKSYHNPGLVVQCSKNRSIRLFWKKKYSDYMITVKNFHKNIAFAHAPILTLGRWVPGWCPCVQRHLGRVSA